MDQHETGTDARIDRRQFLEIGAGLAGALSLGALLAACGAPAAGTAAEVGEEISKQTTLKRYLLIARYNRQKWNSLSAAEQEEAHETAEVLFPEQPKQKSLPLASEGVPVLHSFHTGIFPLLHDKIASNPSQSPSAIVNDIFATWQPPAAEIRDPGIGWLAMLDAEQLGAFVKHMGGREGPLWRMYDIEVIPLNDDRSTQDIYAFMTPISWNK
jgi:hypothetical protein